VDGITAVDEGRGWCILRQRAEPGEDPYFRHLYRVGLDGRALTLLTPGNFDHQIAGGGGGGGGFGGGGQSGMSESARFFVDNYSRVNTVPAGSRAPSYTHRFVITEATNVPTYRCLTGS
jgi:hypothetical protein